MRHRQARVPSAKALLLVLLTLQLVLGLQLQAAQAAAVRMALPPSATAAEIIELHGVAGATNAASLTHYSQTHAGRANCPMHGAHGATGANAAATDVRDATLVAGTHKHLPMGNHDCCHATTCQCHCVYTPGAISMPMLADIATPVAIPSLASAQFVAPRIVEFLRPPIA